MKQIIFIAIITSLLLLVACGTETTQETCNIITGECSGEETKLTDAEQNCKDNQGFLDEREDATYCIFKDGTECEVEAYANENCGDASVSEDTTPDTGDLTEDDTTTSDDTTDTDDTTDSDEVNTDTDTTAEYSTTITVKEGEKVKLNVAATDADGDKLTYKFEAPLNKNGEWQTKEGDADNYEVEVTVSDGKQEVKSTILIVVEATNKAPTLEVKGSLEVEEGEDVILNIETNDAEGDEVIVTVFSTKFTQDDNTFTWKTGFNDAGEYDIKIEASDGKGGNSKTVTVKVNNKNRAPIITGISQE